MSLSLSLGNVSLSLSRLCLMSDHARCAVERQRKREIERKRSGERAWPVCCRCRERERERESWRARVGSVRARVASLPQTHPLPRPLVYCSLLLILARCCRGAVSLARCCKLLSVSCVRSLNLSLCARAHTRALSFFFFLLLSLSLSLALSRARSQGDQG